MDLVLTDSGSARETATTAPAYEDLLRENQELKLALSHANPPPAQTYRHQPPDRWSALEQLVFSELEPCAAEIHVSWPDLLFPSRELSSRLLYHDKLWNSWVHYGLQYPQFDHEHDLFWDEFEKTGSLDGCNPFWLAMYFAVLSTSMLSMGDDELVGVHLPQGIVFCWHHLSSLALLKQDQTTNTN